MQSKSCVYWIHLPEHTDIFSQGYVGVAAKGVEHRFKEHQSRARNGSNFHIHNAIRKYSDLLIVDTVLMADMEYCYQMEAKLRPLPYTGYNISIGGVCSGLGRRLTDDAKQRLSDNAKARGQTVSKEALSKSNATNSKKVAWLGTFADKSIWALADKVFNYILENPTHGSRKVGKNTDIVHTKLQVMYKKIKAGWNPLLDSDWLIFSSKLSPDASGDKSLETGISPN